MLERRLLWLLPLVFIIMGVLWLRNAQKSEGEARLVAAERAAARAGALANAAASRPHAQLPVTTADTQAIAAAASAASLQGTEINRALHVDASGLERRLIAADPSLSPAERAQRLPLATRNQVEALRARGASDEEIDPASEQALGSEAAERLAAVDRERADFARRLAEFRTRREAILRAPGAKDPAIQTLFERSFAPSERLRASLLTR